MWADSGAANLPGRIFIKWINKILTFLLYGALDAGGSLITQSFMPQSFRHSSAVWAGRAAFTRNMVSLSDALRRRLDKADMFLLKGCIRCKGDLYLEDQIWQCLQCGRYYYKHKAAPLRYTGREGAWGSSRKVSVRKSGLKKAA